MSSHAEHSEGGRTQYSEGKRMQTPEGGVTLTPEGERKANKRKAKWLRILQTEKQ